MKQIAFLIFFILSLQWFELLNAQWAKTYGGSEDDLGYGIQQTRDRGYIVSGITASSGAGGGDLWVFKLDSNGTIQWQRIYGGGARDCAYPIQQTSDGGYVVAGETYSFGAGENDFWILKLDPAGLNQWQYTYGGSKIEFPYSLQQTGDGGYIVAGQSDSFGNNDADFWILKLNSTGAIQWQRTYGGWEKECPYSIQKTKDGGFIVAGETRSFGAGDNDFWIVKLSSTGSIDWQYTYGGSGYERAYYIQQTSEGGYVVAGSTDSFGAGGDDFWILKLNYTGAITWQHTYGGDSHERPHSIRQTGDEGYVVIGYTFSFGIGEANFWILKLNPTGAIEWQQTFGRGHFNDPNSLQQTNDGGYIINGFTDSFGAGKYDFLVVKIDSNGYIDPTCEYMKESNATSSDTNILPQDTYVLPVDTNINPQDTPVSPQETDATVSLICGCDTTILSLSTSTLNFGAIVSRAKTRDQQFFILNSGCGTLNWSTKDNADWLTCTPTSGTGSGTVTVSVNPVGLLAGTYNGTITVSDPNAANSPQTVSVTLKVYNSNQTAAPFGQYATPADGSIVSSSIPVTGWALDDIGVESVKIYRGNTALVYIGDAVFVEGARPDIEQAFPDYPMNYKAGWGYMMLTNFLPNGGNGTFKIHAIAMDVEGNTTSLGTKTITIDNANAVKPFGAIDTPTQGGTASGDSFVNWGWVLTPPPNSIPTDGSTINVFVDGVNNGNPNYNNYRADIATLFPGYTNSDGAIGYFSFDTTAYTNGVHTIHWIARDSAGNTDGIGSRYFTIQNSGSSRSGSKIAGNNQWKPIIKIEELSNLPVNYSEPIKIKKGYGRNFQPRIIQSDEENIFRIEIRELERMELYISNVEAGYMLAGNRIHPLPVGSTLDTNNGTFNWIPGSGFYGNYRIVFIVRDQNCELSKQEIHVSIVPKFGLKE